LGSKRLRRYATDSQVARWAAVLKEERRTHVRESSAARSYRRSDPKLTHHIASARCVQLVCAGIGRAYHHPVTGVRADRSNGCDHLHPPSNCDCTVSVVLEGRSTFLRRTGNLSRRTLGEIFWQSDSYILERGESEEWWVE
jgi:hypothetical protein